MSSPSTTIPEAASGFAEHSFELFLAARDEPEWLRLRRRAAFAQFVAAPWPTLRDEEWRRTDIRALKLDAFQPAEAEAPSAAARAALQPAYETLSGHYATGIVQLDGQPTTAADPAKLGGAIFVDMARAARE